MDIRSIHSSGVDRHLIAVLQRNYCQPDTVLQLTRIGAGCFPWILVRAAELGR